MKYFTLTIQKLANGETAQSVLGYNTFSEAKSSFHQEMAYGINAGLNAVTCVIVDENGAQHQTDHWVNPDTEAGE